MSILSVTGAKGGVGCTAVVAGLAGAWSRQKKAVLAFDLCRQNLLRLHFGLDWHERDGWHARLVAGRDWSGAAWRTPDGLSFVPHGSLRDGAAAEVLNNPHWLAAELASLALPSDCRLLLDTPQAGRERAQALAAATHVLVVLPPEPLSCGLIEPLEAELSAHGVAQEKLLYVLNRFDPTRQLDRDVELLLREMLATRLAPLPVHRDEAVREALAMQQQLADYAAHSQACDDFNQLATWLSIRLNGGAKGR
ncbi:cellulose biosynthesis protein BcsQ [Crenobacter sp. SG2303]|uniref:Cellulose biosynthesis protein BcsQ n=1 Tax=Crenobacter oryzisoli TaxID=3056844 RepID=A0ABT7XHT9_9NEIS|nr:cellulose biosynthesis protein BcsQ [Crenobacter sp. SG2303]MDN0073295.1 cellulose biosynthesis protein BcsQ [Crenobacter sp. SG2303]